MDKRNGDQRLWIAVIAQALMDAVNQSSEPHVTDQARLWFERGGSNFRFVCASALKDPAEIRTKALKAIQQSLGSKQRRRAHRGRSYRRTLSQRPGGSREPVKERGDRPGSTAHDLPEIEFFQTDLK